MLISETSYTNSAILNKRVHVKNSYKFLSRGLSPNLDNPCCPAPRRSISVIQMSPERQPQIPRDTLAHKAIQKDDAKIYQ